MKTLKAILLLLAPAMAHSSPFDFIQCGVFDEANRNVGTVEISFTGPQITKHEKLVHGWGPFVVYETTHSTEPGSIALMLLLDGEPQNFYVKRAYFEATEGIQIPLQAETIIPMGSAKAHVIADLAYRGDRLERPEDFIPRKIQIFEAMSFKELTINHCTYSN